MMPSILYLISATAKWIINCLEFSLISSVTRKCNIVRMGTSVWLATVNVFDFCTGALYCEWLIFKMFY